MLTREQILAAPLHREAVEVPEWGGTVCVRVMSAAERIAFEETFNPDGGLDVSLSLLVRTLCDERGALLFDETDVGALHGLDPAPVLRLSQLAIRLNKLTPEDIEGLQGNSAATRSAGSP